MLITPEALGKIKWLVCEHDFEVAWHATLGIRDGKYVIEDVFVYPQKTAAATVESDDALYDIWYAELPDEVYNNLRVQGHSHVNFSVHPSGKDRHNQKDLRKLFDGIYIFLIVNKRGDLYVKPCLGDRSETRYFKNFFSLKSTEPSESWKQQAEAFIKQ